MSASFPSCSESEPRTESTSSALSCSPFAPGTASTRLRGAAFAFAVSAVTLVALFIVDPIYQKVVIGVAIWFGLGLLYFALHGRHHLVLAPEEAFALEALGAESEQTGADGD